MKKNDRAVQNFNLLFLKTLIPNLMLGIIAATLENNGDVMYIHFYTCRKVPSSSILQSLVHCIDLFNNFQISMSLIVFSLAVNQPLSKLKRN